MPAKNRAKQYEEDSRYHLYNRGVDKQKIFRDDQDHAVFLSYLKTYLEPKDEISLRATIMDETASWRAKDQAVKLLRLNNFHESLSLLAYCLMPNHFHFLVHQQDPDTIDRFVNSLGTRYTMYFNKKYKRVGPLFQGVYKAVLVQSDDQLLYLSRYIHRNPLGFSKSKNLASQGQALRSWEYSSYRDYLVLRHTKWVNPKEILSQFGKKRTTSYESFVEGFDENENAAYVLHDASIDVD